MLEAQVFNFRHKKCWLELREVDNRPNGAQRKECGKGTSLFIIWEKVSFENREIMGRNFNLISTVWRRVYALHFPKSWETYEVLLSIGSLPFFLWHAELQITLSPFTSLFCVNFKRHGKRRTPNCGTQKFRLTLFTV